MLEGMSVLWDSVFAVETGVCVRSCEDFGDCEFLVERLGVV